MRTDQVVRFGADDLRRLDGLKQMLDKRRSGQTLRDDKGIVPKRCKQFAQPLGLLRVLCHAIHLSLQLLSSKWPLPVILNGL
jgi:hypothetical protein